MVRVRFVALSKSGATVVLVAVLARASATASSQALYSSPRALPIRCGLDQSLPTETYKILQKRNCERVSLASKDLNAYVVESVRNYASVLNLWDGKLELASRLCNKSQAALGLHDYYRAAHFAVNAWGSAIMEGAECCVMLEPPFCLDTHPSLSYIFCIIFVVLALAVLSGFLRDAWYRSELHRSSGGSEETVAHALPALVRDGSVTGTAAAAGRRCAVELHRTWMEGSPLRALPCADGFARCSASLFGALFERFDFQRDNVRNQYEHLLSLWRSHVATVADRAIEDDEATDERTLLHEALADLHSELLEGFVAWRETFYEAERMPDREGLPPLAGVTWTTVEPALCAGNQAEALDASIQIAEVTAYLLVWGECGNVRFMPEVVYFLTELVLAARVPTNAGLYLGQIPACGATNDAYPKSGLFLTHAVRPIYNVIFDEWYQRVDVAKPRPGEPCGRDSKILHSGFDAYLPTDTANYDDWDELFLDPPRLADHLRLDDQELLFDLEHAERFDALMRMDWQSSLARENVKTHREVHSLLGMFASSHRIWLLHTLLFFAAALRAAEVNGRFVHAGNRPIIIGRTPAVRAATLGLIVGLHGLAVGFAIFHVTGHPVRRRGLLRAMIWLVPIVTYALLRHAEAKEKDVMPYLIVHAATSVLGAVVLLLMPHWLFADRHRLLLWKLTPVPVHTVVLRWMFWIIVFGLKCTFAYCMMRNLQDGIHALRILNPGLLTLTELMSLCSSSTFVAELLEYWVIWIITFVLFVADSQLWFAVGCSVLGSAIVLAQRSCNVMSVAFEDAVAQIPRRLSEKVLSYAYLEELRLVEEKDGGEAPFSARFPLIWDRIVAYMRYEDKCSSSVQANLSFASADSVDGRANSWQELSRPLVFGKAKSASREGAIVPTASEVLDTWSVELPEIFRNQPACERAAKHYCCLPDAQWPENGDMQWRLLALSRGLALPMPRPYRAPYIPGITVLIPHYFETIILDQKDLYDPLDADVPLLDWLATRYLDEYDALTNRLRSRGSASWPHAGSQWSMYTPAQWETLELWSSMRMQTLYRTVAGMCLYHPALQVLYDAQAYRASALARSGIWDPSDCFTCLVSMQMYKFFSKSQLEQVNKMFAKFPGCLRAAFIDCEDQGPNHQADRINPNQSRRYFSCLIDKSCPVTADGNRTPRLRIELPGFPITGDGKGDNQNHAIPFSRGAFIQCIDMNQGAYFEQMLLLPSVLGEFRTKRTGDRLGKRIVGLPEHITSDIGSVGDFAASAERAFGTILQRTYAVLGARMHYGHPDIMNEQYMIQQGGVSKATKTLNLSEDIFAGMDFTLRGEGRKIRHCEYFHLAKGRDLGFKSVLVFFSKISSGAGEQIVSRQMFRLGNVLRLPELLTFWYAHIGYYLNQYLISLSMPALVFLWLLVIISDCEPVMPSFCYDIMNPKLQDSAVVIAQLYSDWFSALMLFFVAATILPLFAEVWYERSIKLASLRVLKQLGTLSPLLFIFQSKLIGFYIMNELRYGGASYCATGRGLPTERIPFLGRCITGSWKLDPKRIGGLYLDYANLSYYDGTGLLLGAIAVRVVGGVRNLGSDFHGNLVYMWVSVGMTIASWLFAPFIFNPYQFEVAEFRSDVKAWLAFFFTDGGSHWVTWWEKDQLRIGQTNRKLANFLCDVGVFLAAFFFMAWYSAFQLKLWILRNIFTDSSKVRIMHYMCLCPPVIGSIAFVAAVVFIERAVLWRRHRRRTEEEDDSASCHSSSSSLSDEGTSCQLPLPAVAISVALVTVAEISFVLQPLWLLRWNATFLAGIIMKLFLRTFVVLLGENLLRSRFFRQRSNSCAGHTVVLWVRANRFLRDLFVSSLILLCLAPIVLLNALSQSLCPGCNLHELLIFRDTGHRNRVQATLRLPSRSSLATPVASAASPQQFTSMSAFPSQSLQFPTGSLQRTAASMPFRSMPTRNIV